MRYSDSVTNAFADSERVVLGLKLPMLRQPRHSCVAVNCSLRWKRLNGVQLLICRELGLRPQTSFTGEAVSRDINVVALVKGEERYIFLFNDGQKSETLRTLGRYASNSKLSFSWYDATHAGGACRAGAQRC